jgi:hypothetical protein
MGLKYYVNINCKNESLMCVFFSFLQLILACEAIWYLSPQGIKWGITLTTGPYLAQTRSEDQQDLRQMLISNV